ncbi:hypothetical protein JG688_00014869 [Phytophthora aleatoria]|uniref:Uncharacterized protein n=1 Tax=Phytophthora aleatoria TaxID=2496075 RepID=A0A8J5M018_9STRA|nr:hypothetical protein JG688_00014869 [Phytophthora aleatoria]
MPPTKKRMHGSTPVASCEMSAWMLAGIPPKRDGCACSSSTRRTWRGGDATAGVVSALALALLGVWANTCNASVHAT